MTVKELREKYLSFFKSKNHTIIPSASLVPAETDSSVLFTTAGMHPLVPYLLGEKHSGGKRVANVQKCVRTIDIDEVGDNRHLTFFEMMGNWSFGGPASTDDEGKAGYFKKEAIEWSFEFLTGKEWLALDSGRIYVTVFRGDNGIPKDENSIKFWQETFLNAGIKADIAGDDEMVKSDVRIIPLGIEDNFWIAGATGPCGGDTEMFYDTRPSEGKLEGKFSDLVKSGRLIEIWNNVFMEYNRQPTTDNLQQYEYIELKQKNVDTGMGVERTLAVLNGKENVFETELFQPIFDKINEFSPKSYQLNAKSYRIIADHIKASVFMIADGVEPSNVMRGYVLRRLIRRAVRHGKLIGIENNFVSRIAEVVFGMYGDFYAELVKNKAKIIEELEKEENKFRETLEKGLKEFDRVKKRIDYIKSEIQKLKEKLTFIKKNSFKHNLSLIELNEEFIKKYLNYKPFEEIFNFYNNNLKQYISPLKSLDKKEFENIKEELEVNKFIFNKIDNVLESIELNRTFIFNLYQTSGLPIEIIREITEENGIKIDEKGFQEELQKHQDLSRASSAGAFKGGLADTNEITVKYHTATHMLLAALREVLGPEIYQKGSNITVERLRFDFNYPDKMTAEQIKKVEDLVNQKINESIPVEMSEMPKDEALKKVKVSFDPSKYGDMVKVYKIGDFSVELCGGPHVKNTSEIGHFKIQKEEASSAGVRRIRAIVE